MCGKRVSETGKRISEDSMNSVALNEAADWADKLMEAEWKGRKDKENVVRYRLAKRVGVPESYLYRLQYKIREMNDVRGSVYRALMIAHQAYEAACEQVEGSADAMRAERMKLKAEDDAAAQGPLAMAGRMETVTRRSAQ